MGSQVSFVRQALRRRGVIGAFAGIAASGCDNPVDKKKEVADSVRAAAAAMAQIHGGEWTTQVDHDTGFILIRLQAEREQPSG